MFAIKQVNKQGHTEMDPSAQELWVANMIAKGYDPGQMNIWQHSHASMSVFISGEDTDTINRLDGGSGMENILWSVVTNANGDIYIQADIFTPVRWTWTNCDYNVRYPQIDGIDEWVKESKKQMVFETPKRSKKVVYGGVASRSNNWGRLPARNSVASYWSDGWEDHRWPEKPRPVVTVNTDDVETEEFTNRVIQAAYDLSIIDVNRANQLEHQSLVDPSYTNEEIYIDMLDDISDFEKKHGLEVDIDLEELECFKFRRCYPEVTRD